MWYYGHMNTKLTQKELSSITKTCHAHYENILTEVCKAVGVNDQSVGKINKIMAIVQESLIDVAEKNIRLGIDHERQERMFYENYNK